MSGELWQPLALFLAGVVASGVVMMIRGDWLGRRAADDAEKRLSEEVENAERRLNTRVDREMSVIGRELKEIKDAVVRLDGRIP